MPGEPEGNKNTWICPNEKRGSFCLEFPDGYCCYFVDSVYRYEVSSVLINCVKCPVCVCKMIKTAFGTCTVIPRLTSDPANEFFG